MYDFECPSRIGSDSYKWNVADGVLPMWVADMDFKTAPEIIEALKKRVEHGVFGYTEIPDRWYDAYINWWKRRHDLEIRKEWLAFSTGVVPSISSIIRKLGRPHENVVLLTPTYNIFFNSIVNNGLNPLECELILSNGEYSIDFNDLAAKLAMSETTLMILCNPHNPVGKIWSKSELKKIGELCVSNGVTVISDEIHCDLTKPDTDYIPFASVDETCKNISVTCIAPTKIFNIAGLQTSALFVPNEFLRNRVIRAINTDEIAEPNAFAVNAAIAAFENGGEWLDQLKALLWQNRIYAEEYISKNVPEIEAIKGEATYLLWIDARKVDSDDKRLVRRLIENVGLKLSAGSAYGKGGEGFLRLNLATSRENVAEGLKRLKDGIALFK